MKEDIYRETEIYFDKCAPVYSIIHIDMPYIDTWQFGTMFSQVDFSRNPVILDLGTGDGNLLLQAGKRNPVCTLVGIDFSGEMLKTAEQRLSDAGLAARLIKTNMEQLPLDSESVDYVLSNGAIHHVQDKHALYAEVFRVLRKNGKLIVCDGFDKTDDEYSALQKKLEQDNPELWNGFIADFEHYQKFLKENIKGDLGQHPVEFHISPSETRHLLEQIGFMNVTIVPGPRQYVIYHAGKK